MVSLKDVNICIKYMPAIAYTYLNFKGTICEKKEIGNVLYIM